MGVPLPQPRKLKGDVGVLFRCGPLARLVRSPSACEGVREYQAS
ncbi:hypothetical protein [Streptomyces sp. NPDC093568]